MGQTAFKQALGIMGSSVLLAGVQGAPIYGMVSLVANLFLDEDEEDFDTITRKYLGELPYKGGVNAIFGVDVANRIGLSNLLFRMNPYNKDRSFYEVLGELAGGPGLSMASQVFRGAKDISEGKDFLRGVETMSPAAVRNAFKTFRYWGEGSVKTRRGDIIYDDITSGELVFQFFGFAPTGLTFQQERNLSTKNIERATSERRTGALRKLYIAFNNGDVSGYEEAMQEIIEFNDRHYTWAIDPETIAKSMEKHYDTTANMHNGISINPKLRAVLEAHRDEYWGNNDWNLARLTP